MADLFSETGLQIEYTREDRSRTASAGDLASDRVASRLVQVRPILVPYLKHE